MSSKRTNTFAKGKGKLSKSKGIFSLIKKLLSFPFQPKKPAAIKKQLIIDTLSQARERDRKQTAKRIHDDITMSLFYLRQQMEINLSFARENQVMINKTKNELGLISQNIVSIQAEQSLDSIGLKNWVQRFTRSYGLRFIHKIESTDLAMSTADLNKISQTVEEACQNIVDHANASELRLNIHDEEASMRIEIQDDGQGFDYELTIIETPSLGLRKMHSLISSIGGKMTIHSNQGIGTLINIEVPKKKRLL